MTYVNKDGMQVYGLGVGLSESSADSSVLIADTLCRYGSVVDSKGQPVWAESQYSKRALQLQVDMIKRYRIMPASAITSTSDEIYSDFAAGKYAMIFGGSTPIRHYSVSVRIRPCRFQHHALSCRRWV